MSVSVRASGPLFDPGLCDAATWDFCEESEEELAERGVRYVREFGSASFRRDTGRYVSRITAEKQGSRHVVHDQRSRYGHWLAGTSERNRSTGFRGYTHWDDARDALDSDAVRIIAPGTKRYVLRLGGRR